MLLGAALAADAFSVSVANAMADREMKLSKGAGIAAVFAIFQFMMPMIGWLLVHKAMDYMNRLEDMVPWIALILLSLIGIKMIADGIKNRNETEAMENLTAGVLVLQGIATSIDALSVGFTTTGYGIGEALLSSLIIGIVTFAICVGGCIIGRKVGDILSHYAVIIGGVILILIGIRIFLGNIH